MKFFLTLALLSSAAMAKEVSVDGFELKLNCALSDGLGHEETYLIDLDKSHSLAKVSKTSDQGTDFLTDMQITSSYDADTHKVLLFHKGRPYKLTELALVIPKLLDDQLGAPRQKAYAIKADGKSVGGDCYVQFIPWLPSK